MPEKTSNLSAELHLEVLFLTPSLSVGRVMAICEDCAGAQRIEAEDFGWAITFSFLVFSVYFTWRD